MTGAAASPQGVQYGCNRGTRWALWFHGNESPSCIRTSCTGTCIESKKEDRHRKFQHYGLPTDSLIGSMG